MIDTNEFHCPKVEHDNSLVYTDLSSAGEYDFVVFDEVHYFHDSNSIFLRKTN